MDSEQRGRKEGQRMNRRDRKKVAIEEQNRIDLEKIEGQLNQLIIENKQIERQKEFNERKDKVRKQKEDRQIRPIQDKEGKRREPGRRRKNRDESDNQEEVDESKINESELKQLQEKGFVVVQRRERKQERRYQIKQRRDEKHIEERYRKEKRYDNVQRQREGEEPRKNIFQELEINQDQAINQQLNKRYQKKQFKDREREEKDKQKERIKIQMQRIREVEREERQRIKQNEKAERQKIKRERDQYKNRVRQEKWPQNENKSSISQKSQKQDIKGNKSSEIDRQNPPQYFLCPITTVMMQSPVILTSCGHTFEETMIRQWLKKQLQCPLCKRDASEMNIVKNFALAQAIRNYSL